MAKDEIGPDHNSVVDVSYEDLRAYLDELSNKKTEASEASGRLRSRIKEIVKEEDWHKGALAQIRAIDDMSQQQRSDFLRTFEPLFDLLMEKVWRQETRDLLDDIQNAED